MISKDRWSSLWRACPQTGDCVANESGAHTSDLELIEIVAPAEFETVTHGKP